MIGGNHQHQSIRIARRHFKRRERDRGGRIAPFGLEEKSVREVLFPVNQLRSNEISLRRVGRNQHIGSLATAEDAPHGLLNQRMLAADPQELLGKQMTAQGPKSGPAPSRHNHWIEMIVIRES
jgi:hypothetical protein